MVATRWKFLQSTPSPIIPVAGENGGLTPVLFSVGLFRCLPIHSTSPPPSKCRRSTTPSIRPARKSASVSTSKGSVAAIDLDQKANTLTLTAEDNFKIEAVWDVLQTRLIKRSVAVKNLKRGDVEPAAGSTVRQVITLQQGIPIEAAKDIVKYLKDQKLKKVQASIQGDQVRISSPSKDDLQGAMQALRAKDFGVALQFGNYR
jgi:uncharacterized protein YajQ (UPF0234 family)